LAGFVTTLHESELSNVGQTVLLPLTRLKVTINVGLKLVVNTLQYVLANLAVFRYYKMCRKYLSLMATLDFIKRNETSFLCIG
jgi:hypothetical protein